MNEWRQMVEDEGLVPSDTMHFAELLRTFLEEEKDEGTHVDRGGGMGQVDYWVKVNGVEYFITVKKSNGHAAC